MNLIPPGLFSLILIGVFRLAVVVTRNYKPTKDEFLATFWIISLVVGGIAMIILYFLGY